MNVSESTPDLLTPKQKEAIQRLRSIRVPPAPILKPDAVRNPPFRYRLASPGIFLAVAALSCLILWPFLRVPESWQGPIPIKARTGVDLMAGKSIAFQFSRGEGTLILQGPAQLHLKSLTRHLITGRIQGDLVLSNGELFLEASSHTPKWIQIQTPLFTVRVTGTQLLVGHRAGQGSRLLVVEGTVQVKSADGPWQEVSPGIEWSVTPDGKVHQHLRQAGELEALKRWEFMEKFERQAAVSEGPSSETDSSQSSLRGWRFLWHEESSR